MIPILLTSSVVAHDSGVKLQDTNERIRFTVECIAHWRLIAPEAPIVVCDGSNFDFADLLKQSGLNAKIECLHFENNQTLVKKHGRGYGEGEIVRYAFQNSRFISTFQCFAKCTSKLWVSNFDFYLKSGNRRLLLKGVFDNVFSPTKPATLSYIDTRFYIMSTRVYEQYFVDAHLKINASKGYGLEDCFTDIVLEHKLQNCMLSTPPIICGVGGGIGVAYRNPWHRRLKEKLRYKIASTNPAFSALFLN